MVQAARIERAWPTFRALVGYQQPTPESKLAASRGVEPRSVDLEFTMLPEPRPLAESGPLEGHSIAATQRFPAVCEALLASLSRMAEGGELESHARKDTICFRGSAVPCTIHLPFGR